MHEDHGRGTDGPDDCDCPCRATGEQAACASSGCGFCRAAVSTVAKKDCDHTRNLRKPCPICPPGTPGAEALTPPNCRACAYSYMEPDSDLICGAVNQPFGLTIRKDLEHCDGGKKFEQHPLRNPDGSLR